MMRPLLRSKKLRRFAYFALTILLVSGAITLAQKAERDPILAYAEELTKAVDAVFLVPKPASNTFDFINILSDYNLNKDQDRVLDPRSKQVKDLEDAFIKARSLIENEAQKRSEITLANDPAEKLSKTDQIEQEKLGALLAVTVAYLEQQKRLYINYFKFVHLSANLGNEVEFYPTAYDHLNLMLWENVGLIFAQNRIVDANNQSYILNAWHPFDPRGRHDRVYIGWTPLQKDEIELAVLAKMSSEESYAKLILFNSIRGRMVNHQKIQSLSTRINVSDPATFAADLSCSKNLVSFRHGKMRNEDYYGYLKKFDHYAEYSRKVQKGLPEVTANSPLLSAERLGQVLMKFFYSLPKFSEYIAPSLTAKDIDGLKTTVPEAALEKIESLWNKKAKTAMFYANFPGDDWKNREQVISRITWQVFKAKRKMMIEQMRSEVKKQNFALFDLSDEEVIKLANQALDSALDLKTETEWRKSMAAKLSNYFQSSQSQDIDVSLKHERLEQFHNAAWPAVQAGAAAHVMKGLSESYRQANAKAFMDRERALNSWQFRAMYPKIAEKYPVTRLEPKHHPWNTRTEYDGAEAASLLRLSSNKLTGAYMSSGYGLPFRLFPKTPEELKQYFFMKLAFFASNQAKDFYRNLGYTRTANKVVSTELKHSSLHERAVAIAKHQVVMQGIQNLFGRIEQKYYERMDAENPSAGKIVSGDMRLYQDLAAAVKEAQVQWLSDIEKLPVQPTPVPDLAAPLYVATLYKDPRPTGLDNWQNLKPKVELKKAFNPNELYVAGGKPRDEAISLYNDALAMLGLYTPVIAKPVQKPRSPLHVANFVELEDWLTTDYRNLDLSYRVAMSYLDQYLLAEVLYDQSVSQFPFLAVQLENKKKSPPLIQLIAKDFNAKTGLQKNVSRAWFAHAIAAVAVNNRGLVDEACSALPFDTRNEEWRNVFRTATNLRASLQQMNANYKTYDKKWMDKTRTKWEMILEDYLDPIGRAVMIGMLIVFIPVGIAGLASCAAMGSFTAASFALGTNALATAVGLSQLSSIAAGSTMAGSMLRWAIGFAGKKIVKTLASKLLLTIFTAQAGAMVYVNVFELPKHYLYQMRVVNTQIGLIDMPLSDRKEVEDYGKMLSTKKGLSIVFGLIQLPMLRPLFVGVKTVAGKTVANALERQMVLEGGEAIVQNVRVKTMQEFVATDGPFLGRWNYLKQSARSIAKNGRVVNLKSSATKAELEPLLRGQLTQLLGSTESAEGIIKARIDNYSKQMLKTMRLVEDVYGQGVKPGFKNWMREKIVKYGIKGNVWNMAMTRRLQEVFPTLTDEAGNILAGEMKAAAGSVKSLNINSLRNNPKIREALKNYPTESQEAILASLANGSEFFQAFIRVHVEQIYQTRSYWTQQWKILKLYQIEMKGEPDYAILKSFMGNMKSDDFLKYEQLLNWVNLEKSGNMLNASINKSMFPSKEMNAFKQMFKDHKILMKELDIVTKPTKIKFNSNVPVVAFEAADDASMNADDAGLFNKDPKVEPLKSKHQSGSENDMIPTTDPKTGETIYVSKNESLIIMDIDPSTGEFVFSVKTLEEVPQARGHFFRVMKDKIMGVADTMKKAVTPKKKR